MLNRLILAVLLVFSLNFNVQAQRNNLLDSIEQAADVSTLQAFIPKAEQLTSSNPELGQEISQTLLEKAQDFKSASIENQARLWLGVSLYSLEKYDSAITVMEEWQEENIEAPFYLLQRNFYKSIAHYYLGEYNTSVSLLLSTVNEPILQTDQAFYGRYLRFLGEVYRAADNLSPALEYLQMALEIGENASDSVGIAASLNRMGVVYYQKAEHEIAEKLLQRSLEVSIAANVRSVMANNFNDLGELYFATEEFEKCLELYENALIYAENSDVEINTLNNIARLDWKLGRFQEAIARAKEALNLALESNILTYQVDASKIIADSYEEWGDFSQATFYYKQYIDYREKLFEEEQSKQIIELETRYQSSQKEKEIELLTQREAAERELKSIYQKGLIVLALFLILLFLLFIQIRKSNNKISLQNKKLEELNNTKDKFFSIIAHDLRSPMIALQGVGRKLEYYIKKDRQEKLLEMGGKIDQSIDHLNNLLNNLLNWAASQSGGIPHHPELTNLGQLVRENMELFKSLAESKGIQMANEVADAKAFVDLNTVSTVIRNVLSNAIKFSPENGKVVFTSREVGNQIVLSISDRGRGMNEEQLENLFSQSIKSQVGTRGEKGFGLGLKLCHEFMLLNDGSMQVSSNVGRGTEVELYFPKEASGKLRQMA